MGNKNKEKVSRKEVLVVVAIALIIVFAIGYIVLTEIIPKEINYGRGNESQIALHISPSRVGISTENKTKNPVP